MKFDLNWWFPDGETHLTEWMRNKKGAMVLNGRAAYQGAKQDAALSHVKQFRHALDIGGHVGLWSFNLAYQFAVVDAFEPVAEHRACFVKNVEAENVMLHAIALGDKDGSISIKTAPTSSGDSWISGEGNIPMRRLDDFGFNDVDFIKIDTEGAEELVIRGGLETIKRCRPIMVVEQKGHEVTHFGLKKDGAIALLWDIGMKPLCKPISGDWIMGWPA